MQAKYKEKSGNEEFKYDFVDKIGVIAEYPTGWKKEINLVAWNEAAAKIDIRDWDSKHQHMSRGITLKEDEAKALVQLLAEYYELPEAANA